MAQTILAILGERGELTTLFLLEVLRQHGWWLVSWRMNRALRRLERAQHIKVRTGVRRTYVRKFDQPQGVGL